MKLAFDRDTHLMTSLRTCAALEQSSATRCRGGGIGRGVKVALGQAPCGTRFTHGGVRAVINRTTPPLQ